MFLRNWWLDLLGFYLCFGCCKSLVTSSSVFTDWTARPNGMPLRLNLQNYIIIKKLKANFKINKCLFLKNNRVFDIKIKVQALFSSGYSSSWITRYSPIYHCGFEVWTRLVVHKSTKPMAYLEFKKRWRRNQSKIWMSLHSLVSVHWTWVLKMNLSTFRLIIFLNFWTKKRYRHRVPPPRI